MSPNVQIFKLLESVIQVLDDEKFKLCDGVEQLKEVYKATLEKTLYESNRNGKRHPLIVVEGLDACGKTTLTAKLCKVLDAALLCTPPRSLHNIREIFDSDAILRAAFYAMGNYIAALEISMILKTKPVILDRFWYSTVAYALAQQVHEYPELNPELPQMGDEVYQWPLDLLKPDMVLFLDVSEEVRIQRLSRRSVITTQETLLQNNHKYRENVVKAYKNMENPEVILINADPSISVVLEEMLVKIRPLLF